MSARSYLYVPADRLEMLAKAADRSADGLTVDFEEAVAPSRKVEVRRTLGRARNAL
jgi:citrate lyase subunit beta/citryl-CoA lyase